MWRSSSTPRSRSANGGTPRACTPEPAPVKLPGFTGIDSEYEVPAEPHLVLGPDSGSLAEQVSRVLLEPLEGILR